MAMRLNGTVHIQRDENANYVLSFAPLGVEHFGRPQRRFKGWKQMVAFLQGPLHVGLPEVRAALNALMRNGAYCLDGVWLSEAEMHEHGLAYAYAHA
jgi:hypothetical protein